MTDVEDIVESAPTASTSSQPQVVTPPPANQAQASPEDVSVSLYKHMFQCDQAFNFKSLFSRREYVEFISSVENDMSTDNRD